MITSTESSTSPLTNLRELDHKDRRETDCRAQHISTGIHLVVGSSARFEVHTAHARTDRSSARLTFLTDKPTKDGPVDNMRMGAIGP